MPKLKSRSFYLCQIIISAIALAFSVSLVDANPDSVFFGIVFGLFLNVILDCFLLIGLWKFFRYKKLLKEQENTNGDLHKNEDR